MMNIDELLINAQLEERPSVSLPWDNKDQHRDDKHVVESSGEIKGTRPETVKYKDHNITEDINYQNDTVKWSYSNANQGYDPKRCHTESDLSWQNDSRRTLPVLKDDKLPVYMPKHHVSAYEQPVSAKVNGLDRATILATNKRADKEEYGPNNPHTSTRRTTSVKVSRNMIQEAKLGYKVPTMSKMNKSVNKGKSSRSEIPLALHTNDHTNDHKPARYTTGLRYQTITKNKESDKKTDYRTNRHNVIADTAAIRSVPKTDYVTKRNDIDELNSLLDETADAMDLEYSKHGVRKEVCPRKHEVSRTEEELKYHINGDFTNDDKNLTNVNKSEQERFSTIHNRRTAITGLESKAARSKQDDEQSVEFSESSSSISDGRENIDARKEPKENIDELLKFQCQMMDIKQPKLMSKRKRCQKSITDTHEQDGVLVGKQNENDTLSSIDYAKIDELNKKSEALFWKKVRDGKKRKDKKSNIIYVNPEPNRRRARMKNEKVDKSEPLSVVTKEAIERSAVSVEMDETKSDVYDITPAGDRNDLYDSDSVNIDSMNPNNYNGNVRQRELVEKVSVPTDKPCQSYTLVTHDRKPALADKNVFTRSKSSLKQAKSERKKKRRRLTKPGEDLKTRTSARVLSGEYGTQNNLISYAGTNITGVNQVGLKNGDISPTIDARLSPITVISYDEINERLGHYADIPEELVNNTRNVTPETNLADIAAFQQKPRNCSLKQDAVTRFSLKSGDILCKPTDTHTDSDDSSCDSLISGRITIQSVDLGVPRPATNRTYILHTDDANYPNYSSEIDGESIVNDGDDHINKTSEEKKGQKLSKLRTFWNWITCCAKPKTDN